jgi:hypothetical protein
VNIFLTQAGGFKLGELELVSDFSDQGSCSNLIANDSYLDSQFKDPEIIRPKWRTIGSGSV